MPLNVPLIITAIRPNPSYFFTNFSRTMPVPELISIAPNSGVQPDHSKCFTSAFLDAARTARNVKPRRARRRRKGMGEGMYNRAVDESARSVRVSRSPRQLAIGGAILSVRGERWIW